MSCKTDRERLIEITKKAQNDWLEKEYDNATNKKLEEYVADYLLANGVIVPPCKVGTRHNNLTFIAVDDVKTREKGRPYYILMCDSGNIKSVRI